MSGGQAIHPTELRWADPDQADTPGQRELLIAIANLTEQVMRIADHLEQGKAS